MTRITLDPAALANLDRLTEPVEVCDTSGRVVGYFHPAADERLYRSVQVPFTDEELDRFEQEPGGRSLAEIISDLENEP